MQVRELEWALRLEHGTAIVELHGDINAAAEGALNAAYSQACQQAPNAIQLDLKDVDYINSAGIALLIGLLAEARDSNRRFLASGVNDHYQEIFRITRLADMMTLVQ